MSYLNIRYPTGHLEVIAVVPQAPLLKVLESACIKRSLDPRTHKLIHKRKALDLSVPFRYSGLTNRATLELVACDAPRVSSSNVKLAFRLQDGYRIEWEGSSDSTLWDILYSLAQKDERVQSLMSDTSDGLEPTVIYLQNKFNGENMLKETTLDGLGVKGSALFQLHKTLAVQDSSGTSQPIPSGSRATSDGLKKQRVEAPAQSSPAQRRSPSPSQQQQPSRAPPPQTPSQPPVSQMGTGSASLIFPSSGAAPAGPAAPFSLFAPTPPRSIFDPEEETQRNRQDQTVTIGEMLGISLEPGSRSSLVESGSTQFQEFRFPSETEGQNLIDTDEPTETVHLGVPCDREPRIFRRQTSESVGSDASSLPDSFFEMTEADLRRVLTDLRKEMGEDAMLGEYNAEKTTRKRYLARFPRCIIRFTWSDEIILQACFRPTEPVSALYDFIREQLADKKLKFKLFLTPPRQFLNDMTQNLIEAQLVPLTKVHMSVENGATRAADLLRPELLRDIGSEAGVDASKIASEWISKFPRKG